MDVTIFSDVEFTKYQVRQALKDSAKGSDNISLRVAETFDVDASDLSDFTPSDLIELYSALGDIEQKDVINQLQDLLDDKPSVCVGFSPSNLEDQQKYDAFLEHRNRFTVEQFINLLNMKNPVESPDPDRVVLCPHCDEFLDPEDYN